MSFHYACHSSILSFFFFLDFVELEPKCYLITSQTRVKRVSRIHHRNILGMAWWCIPLTCLNLVCDVIRYCLVQVRQNLKKKKTFRVGGPQSPFSISSSFILFFILFPFFFKTQIILRKEEGNLTIWNKRWLFLTKAHKTPFRKRSSQYWWCHDHHGYQSISFCSLIRNKRSRDHITSILPDLANAELKMHWTKTRANAYVNRSLWPYVPRVLPWAKQKNNQTPHHLT